MLFLFCATQQAYRSTVPIDVPKSAWVRAGVPYDEPGGPPQRHLVLSNGPEQIGAWCFGEGKGWANLYWGEIPFPGRNLRLRVYVDHLIDPQGPIDNVDVRFCLGVRNAKGSSARITQRVSTLQYTPADVPRQYIDPGQKLAFAHLARRWQITSTKPEPIGDEASPGVVPGLGMRLSRSPEHRHYGNLVAELEIEADQEMASRTLLVRTVATQNGEGPGASSTSDIIPELGTMNQEGCIDSGAGERGWWPKADIYIHSNPQAPIPINASPTPAFAGFFHLIGSQALE